MIKSFKEFVSNFQDFSEMARKAGSDMPPVDIFDSEDQKYYRYIYDAAKKQVEDPNTMRLLIQKSICARYGAADAGGMLWKARDANSDKIDLTFSFTKHKPVVIKDIPFGTEHLLSKIENAGWDVDDHSFGYKFGPCTWKAFMGVRAEQYIKFLETGVMPDKKHLMYHSRFNASSKKASLEDKLTRQKAVEAGAGKKKRDFEEFDVKSMEKIPLDGEDVKYLDSVREKLTKKAIANNWFPDNPKDNYVPQEIMDKALQKALSLRYSDKWITKDDSGEFAAKAPKDPNEPLYDGGIDETGGPMYGQVGFTILRPLFGHPEGKREMTPVKLNDVYLNIPHLMKKFKKYKLSKDFVKEPLSGDIGMQVAQRWMAHKSYGPNIGTKYGSNIPDEVFYNQISKDHESWRKSGGNPVRGNPVENPELAEKLVWRDGDVIMESPNENDEYEKRDASQFTWEDLMKDDASRAVKSAISFLGNKRFANQIDKFNDWVKSSDEKISMQLRAFTELTTRKTGENPGDYRKESKRLCWCWSAIVRYVDETYLKRSSGEFGKEDDMPSSVDLTRSRDYGNTVNTMMPSSKTREEEPEEEKDDFSDFQQYLLSKKKVPQASQPIPQATNAPVSSSWKDFMKRKKSTLPGKPGV